MCSMDSSVLFFAVQTVKPGSKSLSRVYKNEKKEQEEKILEALYQSKIKKKCKGNASSLSESDCSINTGCPSRPKEKRLPAEKSFLAKNRSSCGRRNGQINYNEVFKQLDGVRTGNSWSDGETSQNSTSTTESSDHLDYVANDIFYDEEGFLLAFKKWEKQFSEWKKANETHPNRNEYLKYVEQVEDYRAKIVDARKVMEDAVKLAQMRKTAMFVIHPLHNF